MCVYVVGNTCIRGLLLEVSAFLCFQQSLWSPGLSTGAFTCEPSHQPIYHLIYLFFILTVPQGYFSFPLYLLSPGLLLNIKGQSAVLQNGRDFRIHLLSSFSLTRTIYHQTVFGIQIVMPGKCALQIPRLCEDHLEH